MTGETYVKCDVVIVSLARSGKAVLVYSETADAQVWIPRSLIHGADDRELSQHMDEAIELRVFQWFAEKNGLY